MSMDRLRHALSRLPSRRRVSALGRFLRRRRRTAGFTLLAVALAPLFWWGTCFTGRMRPASAPVAAPAPSPAAAVTPAEDRVEPPPGRTVTLRPGCNVYTLLVQAGMPSGDVLQLIRDFTGTGDLKRCRPGESFTLRRGTDGAIVSVGYQKGPLERYLAEKTGTSWRVLREKVPYTTRIERVAGPITSSLFEAVADAGEKDSLAIALISILAWEIDFAHESQPGDRFSLLVEKRELEGRTVSYGPILAATYASSERVIRSFSLAGEGGGLDYFNDDGLSTRKTFLKSPLRFSRITSGYTSRRLHPVSGIYRSHFAIDYAAPTGTPVWSVADGTVRTVGYDAGSGRKVSISHPGGYESWYLHLSRYARGLAVGKRVRQEQVIGYVGATGLATGPHLDYRLTRNGAWVNPLREDFPRGLPVPRERMAEFRERREWLASLMDPGQAVASFSAKR